MATKSARERHIQQKLAEYAAQEPANRETYRIQFPSLPPLPVIEIPLEMAVLNTQSFRIAARLADHPDRASVEADPDGEKSQQIVADLVREIHREAHNLKSSLETGGQRQPGVITRSGKLINANTRWVLLRDLWNEGVTTAGRLRVAVLPATFSAADELQLESVLQQQREHKDEYTFVSELLMLRGLVQDAGLSPAQIAAQQERKDGESEVRKLLEVLDLMDVARRLLDPANPIPLSTFDSETSRKENWLGILNKYRALRKSANPADADELLRAFLVTDYLKLGAVHKGVRAIHKDWLREDFVRELKIRDDAVSKSLVAHIEVTSRQSAPEVGLPTGADLLGDVPTTPDAPISNAVLGLVQAAATREVGDLDLAEGQAVDATEVLTVLGAVAQQAIANSNRGDPAERPGKLLEAALKDLRGAQDALADVVADDGFAAFKPGVDHSLTTIGRVVDAIRDLLEDADSE